jgi:hypothetical protein
VTITLLASQAARYWARSVRREIEGSTVIDLSPRPAAALGTEISRGKRVAPTLTRRAT